ncbi:GGDEF domain-containing protein [Legionella pneumophila serogroup 1]|uniref:diguanylate cyclase n=1 Tax=Legionella moravica TaxID=39962 RepID=A0A378JYK6_9GAMM|nr:GGDEF domain-containing protein [Legionella moravica]HAT7052158.1 diguanylate cyclase [Legionella pneumophila]KTD35521.1 Diguanylate kinase [Legionella moravica]STX62109.1 Diguanylate kinase [Legionella moravica]HAT7054410.1 diguanylate cyclase [Legionella pneumophila]HAT7064303.1 diguanylate cyclase [Legionella pneumophila]
MVISIVMILFGIVFLSRGAYLIKAVLQQTSYYRPQWHAYLAFIAFFIASYLATIIYGVLVDPHCLNYFYATIFLVGGLYVYLSCHLTTKTIRKIELMDTLKMSYEKLHYHANHDSLTGCNNRESLFEILKNRFQQIKLDGGQLIVMFIDMDGFKAVNDHYGHDVGDTTLQYFGQLLRQRLRKDDIVARYGGDEFVIVMEQISSEDAQKIAEDIVRTTQQSINEETLPPLKLGCSIGITQMNNQSTSFNAVIKEADRACYAAKQRKINGSVCMYSQVLSSEKEHNE